MKEHFQDYGVRKWAGDDLIELQSEPLAALQTLVEPYAPCIVSGCEVTPVEPRGYAIAPGLVALPGKDAKGKACVKLARFAGVKSGNDEEPYYLTLTYQTATRTYMDGKSKAIAYDYTATPTRNRPEKEGTFLEIGAEGDDGQRLVDRLGITQKLDQEGGDASAVKVTFNEAAARELPESGNRLGAIVGSVRRWFSDLRALAFKDKVALSDLDTDTAEALDRKVDNSELGLSNAINKLSESSATPKDNDFYISQYAGGGTENTTYWRRRMSALWLYIKGKLTSVAGVNISGNATTATSATKATQDSTGQQIDTTYIKALQANGTTITYTKGNGSTGTITTKDTVYSHPAYTAKSSGLYKITVDGTGHIKATTAVTKADITALGIPGQDTNTVYTHPTGNGYNHIPSGGSSGQYLKYSSTGTATWANLAPFITFKGNVSSNLYLSPGFTYQPTANITVTLNKATSFSQGNFSFLNNTGWVKIKVNKAAGVIAIFSEMAKNRNDNTNNAGLWIFIWATSDIVYVDFIEEATRLT